MIQPLRSIHRLAWAAMAAVLPAVLVIGLAARRRIPVSTHACPTEGESAVMETSDLWQKHTVRSKFYRKPGNPGLYLLLQSTKDLKEPDPLLYWAASPPQENSLPADAKFMGAFEADKSIFLSDENRTGYLILYSPAHQMVVDTARAEKLP